MKYRKLIILTVVLSVSIFCLVISSQNILKAVRIPYYYILSVTQTPTQRSDRSYVRNAPPL